MDSPSYLQISNGRFVVLLFYSYNLRHNVNLACQTYFVFIGINSLAIYATWQWFPEFRQLSLEEIDLVFETDGTRPVALANKLQEAKIEKRGELHLA
jgi:hypothetical protein